MVPLLEKSGSRKSRCGPKTENCPPRHMRSSARSCSGERTRRREWGDSMRCLSAEDVRHLHASLIAQGWLGRVQATARDPSVAVDGRLRCLDN